MRPVVCSGWSECDIDTTPRIRAQQQVLESEARLRQVVESLPVVLSSQ